MWGELLSLASNYLANQGGQNGAQSGQYGAPAQQPSGLDSTASSAFQQPTSMAGGINQQQQAMNQEIGALQGQLSQQNVPFMSQQQFGASDQLLPMMPQQQSQPSPDMTNGYQPVTLGQAGAQMFGGGQQQMPQGQQTQSNYYTQNALVRLGEGYNSGGLLGALGYYLTDPQQLQALQQYQQTQRQPSTV